MIDTTIDRARVIKGLEGLCERLFHEYKVCHKGDEEDTYNWFLVANDALVLLKEQEAVTVESIQMDRSDKWGADLTGYCPSCKRPLKNRFNPRFCGECGRSVKWE